MEQLSPSSTITELESTLVPGESQGRQSLVGCHPWGRTESDTTEATSQQQQQSSGGAPAQLLCSTWGPPGPGVEPASAALAGGFFITEPSVKP